MLRKGKKLFQFSSGRVETIQKASNNRITGEVRTDTLVMSTDFVHRQIDFGFLKLLPAKPDKLSSCYIGTVVQVRKNFHSVTKGIIGVCYEMYHIDGEKGASFIFENRFYDGFSKKEQETLLNEIGFSKELSSYKFENVSSLEKDYLLGVFDSVLHKKNFTHFYD